MRVIKPVTIDAAKLVSTDATETYSAWSSLTTYNAGDKVIKTSTQRVYQAILGVNLNKDPETEVAYWVDIGPTNKWAMFDTSVSTLTSQTGGLSVVIKPGYVNSLALFGLYGTSLTITVRNGLAGPVVYTNTVSLETSVVADWYQYFFEPFSLVSEVTFTDLPPYSDAHITIDIAGGGTVTCGIVSVGTMYFLGDTQYDCSVGIIDYSRKDTDEFGVTTLVRRGFSKRLSATIELDNSQLNNVIRILSDLRAEPCAWIATDEVGYAALNVFGYYRDFTTSVRYFSRSLCSLEVEGLV